VSAEIARLEGRYLDSIRHLSGHSSSREHGFVQMMGLATDSPRRSMQHALREDCACVFARRRHCYLRWEPLAGTASRLQLSPHLTEDAQAPGPTSTILASCSNTWISPQLSGSASSVGRDLPRNLDSNTYGDAVVASGLTRCPSSRAETNYWSRREATTVLKWLRSTSDALVTSSNSPIRSGIFLRPRN